MTTRISILFLLLLCSTSLTLSAQEDPIRQRGRQAATLSSAEQLDAVNLFNGNLTIRIPLGIEYPVGGALSYALAVQYNHNVWDFDVPTEGGIVVEPDFHSNAGLGWRLSLGRLFAPANSSHPSANVRFNEEIAWVLVDGDGSRHRFFDRLHLGDDEDTPSSPVTDVLYSRDGSYLRLRLFDDMTAKADSPDGLTRTFDSTGRLNRIEDRFGNYLDIGYSNQVFFADHDAYLTWTLQDRHGRQHIITFREVPVQGADIPIAVESVELAAFGGSTSLYSFGYDDVSIPRDPKDGALTSDAIVPVLRSIDLPGNSGTFGFTYYQANGGGGISGYLESMTLPTLGRYEYDYGVYTYDFDPNGGPLSTTNGVNHRRLFEAGQQIALGVWSYSSQGLQPSPCDSTPYTCFRATATLARTPDGDEALHYFALSHDFVYWIHGLPFDPFNEAGSGTASDPFRYFSRQMYDGLLDPDDPARTEYARFTADGTCTSQDRTNCNKRLEYSRTVYEKDGNRYAETFHENFDGFGHYRTMRTGGNFTSGNVRETYVEYIPAYLLAEPDSTPGELPGSFEQVPADEPWLIETFRARHVSENGVTAKEEICFDTDGLLTRRRTLKGGSRGAHDLLVLFSHDPQGNLAYEDYHGGDNHGLGTGTHVCSMSSIGPDDYGIHHTYQYGSLKTSAYTTAQGLDRSYFLTDNDIDPSTGLVATSRDTSGLATVYEYDELGRTRFVKAAEGAWTELEYAQASGGTRASVTITSRANGDDGTGSEPSLLAQYIERFDGFGRLEREEELLSSGSLRRRDTTYTPGGLRASVSEWSTDDPPLNKTLFMDYDPFGRPRKIRPPDGPAHDVDLSYAGVRLIDRTVRIAAGAGGSEIAVTTTEEYDRQGRLIKVTEPSGTGGAAVTTDYSYDVGNRLAEVSVGGSQQRVFQYDNRGLLVREEHPEKAANTAGTMDPECCGSVFYCDYDARGHAHRRNEGQTPTNPSTLDSASCQARSFDLTFTFDRGERLVQVRKTGGNLLEERTYFGTADSGANPSHRKGKLKTATRHNWLERGGGGATDYRVTESYFYRGVDGRISERSTTVIAGGAPLAAFGQSFQYDHLGNPSGLGYPCALDLFGACASPPPPLSFDYTNGWLTGVDELDFPPKITADISYHDNGALAEMTLDDGDDEWYYAQGMDLNEMQRMAWVAASPNEPPTSGLELTYDGAGNVKTYGNQVFHYDRVSRVVHHHVGGTSQDYSYDRFGNLKQLTTKTYDSGGTETSSSTRSIPVRTTSNQMSSGTYDQAGNVLAAGAGATFEWDALSTMTRYVNGSVDNSFVYTADGERIAVLHDGLGPAAATWTVRDLDGKVLRQFEPDPAQGLFSDGFEAGNTGCWSSVAGGAGGTILGSCAELLPVRRYAHREGKILASVDEQAPGQPTHYYHLNYRDTPNIVSDTNGNFDLRVYMAFGEEVTTGGSTFELPHKFTGHERDLGVATGGSTPGDDDLDYMHARYYWPIFGRFLSTDPIDSSRGTTPQTWNKYTYALNNPARYVDPDGEAPETLWDVFNVGLGTLSAISNFRQGNIGSGLLDTGGVLLDLGAAAIPFLPGGASSAIKVARAADKVGDAAGAATNVKRVVGLPTTLTISAKQFGKKLGQKARDLGLDPSNARHREQFRSRIERIFNRADEVRRGTFRGQKGEVLFFRRGRDIVLTTADGEFITILVRGIDNSAFRAAGGA